MPRKAIAFGRLVRQPAAHTTLPAGVSRRLSASQVSLIAAALAAPSAHLDYPEFSRRAAADLLAIGPPTGKNHTAVKEEHWLEFNYCRRRAARAMAATRRTSLTISAARDLANWLTRTLEMRNAIVSANRGLCYTVALKMKLTMDLDDAIAEADIALMRSVDYFDFRRGVRFASYACRAIVHRLRRASKPAIATDGLDPDGIVEDAPPLVSLAEIVRLREVLASNAAELTPEEHGIISRRFGLGCEIETEAARRNDWLGDGKGWHRGKTDGTTALNVSRQVGLRTEEVEAIEQSALVKLRAAIMVEN